MPDAHSRHIKYWLRDHDTDYVNEAPPVQNTWYVAFDAEDVRLLWCKIYQSNDELANKIIQIRWEIDGNVYRGSINADNNTQYYVFRNYLPSNGGTAGLGIDTVIRTAVYNIDKRGLDFKVDVRITDPVGTNQVLICWCVRETFVET